MNLSTDGYAACVPAPRLWQSCAARGLWAVLGIAVLVLGGCAEMTQQQAETEDTLEYVWPLPPEQPRIRFLRSISTPADIGATEKPTLLTSLLGEEGPPVLRMNKPYAVHADRDGRIFVADTGWGKVLVFDAANKIFQVWGQAGQGALSQPLGVTSDSQGRIYVTDGKQKRVVVFDRDGKYLMAAGRKGELERPAGIVVNERLDRIYVADVARHQIAIFDMGGNLVGSFGGRGKEPGKFNFPTNLAADRYGNIYVVDAMNFRVQVLDPNGSPKTTFGQHSDRPGGLARPKGIGVDPDGHIYVVDAAFNNFQIFDPDGRLLLFIGGAGRQPGQFYLPAGAYLDAQGRFYVVDQMNSRVQVFQYLGDSAEPADSPATEPTAVDSSSP